MTKQQYELVRDIALLVVGIGIGFILGGWLGFGKWVVSLAGGGE